MKYIRLEHYSGKKKLMFIKHIQNNEISKDKEI